MALDRPRYDRSRRRFGVTGRPHRFPAAAVLVVVVVVVVVDLSPRYPELAVNPGRVGIRG
ncbi:MAG: hypothetical protein V7738_06020 [Dietzia maris]